VCSFLQALIILLFDGGDSTGDLPSRHLLEIDRIHYVLETVYTLLTRVTSSMMDALSIPVSQTDIRLLSLFQKAIAQSSPIKLSSELNRGHELLAPFLLIP
jgi:hypothetical protein